ncbi:quinone oxidoreductase-like protein 2 homolog [Ptychodera flava]|uniref:quinone oxidoreductase-like protein 2 homolog n=1 Tax=Ptychodera flava TaxID=63121 RepID=UPI00396A2BA8
MDKSSDSSSSKTPSKMAAATFRCPPELLLRPLVRRGSQVTLKPKLTANISTSSAKNTYKAAVCEDYDKPLVVRDMPSASPGELEPGMVRVAVQCCAVNFADILICKGKYQVKIPTPFVPGSEIAGKITDVGENVRMFQKGDRVFGHCQLNGFSGEAIASAQSMWKIPPSVSFEEAASIPTSYGTAMLALTQRAKIRSGETVLVTAAAGGVGLATVDLAKHVFNATVIGAAGGPEKCALVKRRGADHVIDYTKENIRERIREITDGNGVNIVCDSVGGDLFTQCLKSLSWEGRIVVIGFASGTIPKIPANLLLLKNAAATGVWWGEHKTKNPGAFRRSVDHCVDHLLTGQLQPYISKTFPLSKINEAFEYVQTRKSSGKVLVNITESVG